MNALVYIGAAIAGVYLLGKLFFNWYEDLPCAIIQKYGAVENARSAVEGTRGAAYVFFVTFGVLALALVALVGSTSGLSTLLDNSNRLFFIVALTVGIGLIYLSWANLPKFLSVGDKLKITLGNLVFGLLVVSLIGMFLAAIGSSGSNGNTKNKR